MAAWWPRAVAALLLAAGAASGGAIVLMGAPAVAATCGGPLQAPCAPPPPVVQATSSETSGAITITWTPNSKFNTIFPDDPTLVWTPQASGAPTDPATIPTTTPQPLGPCAATTAGTLACTYSWPSTLLDDGYILNGTYTLSASAKECPVLGLVQGLCSTPTSGSLPVEVQNPAVAPTGVKAALVSGANPQEIQVQWLPNPEPDVVGYEVYQGTSTTPFCSAATSASNPLTYSCTGTPTTNGTYSFHVVAYRYGATFSDKVADQVASAPSAATPKLTVSGITTTVTTKPASNTLGNIGVVSGKKAPATGGHTFGTVVLASPVPSTTTTTLGGDFSPVLPYGTTTTQSTIDPAAISVPTKHKSSSVATVAAIGAGLLIATIALHGVWLRSEVRRSGQLEPLDPETFSRR